MNQLSDQSMMSKVLIVTLFWYFLESHTSSQDQSMIRRGLVRIEQFPKTKTRKN